MKDYLRDASDNYYKNNRETKDISSHPIIRLLPTHHKEKLYKLMKDAEFTEDDVEMVHRKYSVRMPVRHQGYQICDASNYDKMQ
eukprot:6408158-Amphidinium_carterae.8